MCPKKSQIWECDARMFGIFVELLYVDTEVSV